MKSISSFAIFSLSLFLVACDSGGSSTTQIESYSGELLPQDVADQVAAIISEDSRITQQALEQEDVRTNDSEENESSTPGVSQSWRTGEFSASGQRTVGCDAEGTADWSGNYQVVVPQDRSSLIANVQQSIEMHACKTDSGDQYSEINGSLTAASNLRFQSQALSSSRKITGSVAVKDLDTDESHTVAFKNFEVVFRVTAQQLQSFLAEVQRIRDQAGDEADEGTFIEILAVYAKFLISHTSCSGTIVVDSKEYSCAAAFKKAENKFTSAFSAVMN